MLFLLDAFIILIAVKKEMLKWHYVQNFEFQHFFQNIFLGVQLWNFWRVIANLDYFLFFFYILRSRYGIWIFLGARTWVRVGVAKFQILFRVCMISLIFCFWERVDAWSKPTYQEKKWEYPSPPPPRTHHHPRATIPLEIVTLTSFFLKMPYLQDTKWIFSLILTSSLLILRRERCH